MSIYQEILDNLTSNGDLRADFQLDESSDSFIKPPGKPGEVEGLSYISLGYNYDSAFFAQLKKSSLHPQGVAFSREEVVQIQKARQRLIKDQKPLGYFSRNRLVEILTQSESIDQVKLAILAISFDQTMIDPELREILLHLALYESFTGYVIQALSHHQEDIDGLVFELVKKLKGWGKAIAIHSLRKVTPEQAEWLLGGYKCTIRIEYIALAVAELIDLPQILEQDDMDDHTFGSVLILIDGLLSDRTFEHDGILEFPNWERMLRRLRHHARRATPELIHLFIYRSITSWLKELVDDEGLHLVPLFEQMEKRVDWRSMIVDILENKDKSQLNYAILTAQRFNIDASEVAFLELKNHSSVNIIYLPIILKNDALRQEALAWLEDHLPLEKLLNRWSLTEDRLPYSSLTIALEALESYPGEGISLIETGLRSADLEIAQTALETILEWLYLREESLQEAYPELYRLAQQRLMKESEPELNDLLSQSIVWYTENDQELLGDE